MDILPEGHDGIYFKMEDSMISYHNKNFNSEFIFEKSSKLIDGNGKLI